jgi:hypothetical protein
MEGKRKEKEKDKEREREREEMNRTQGYQHCANVLCLSSCH